MPGRRPCRRGRRRTHSPRYQSSMGWRKIEVCHRVMPHEFRPDQIQIGPEDQRPEIGPFPQGEDFKAHNHCPAGVTEDTKPTLPNRCVVRGQRLHLSNRGYADEKTYFPVRFENASRNRARSSALTSDTAQNASPPARQFSMLYAVAGCGGFDRCGRSIRRRPDEQIG